MQIARTGMAVLASLASLATAGCVGWAAFCCPEGAANGVKVDEVAVESLHRIRVVVRPGLDGSESKTLATCLRKTAMFGDVVETESNRNVELAATIVERAPSGPQIPLLPAMTFGILPQWFECPIGFLVRFSSLPNAPQMMEFDCRCESVLVLGWPSMLLTPFSAFATCMWWGPEGTQEFADFVRARMLGKARDLARLAGVPENDEKQVRDGVR
jgi:hypothetical protein